MHPNLSGLDLLAGPEELTATCRRLARMISDDHPDGVTLIGVLPDAVVFLADLARLITVPVEIDFIGVAAYDGQLARTRLTKDLDRPLHGRAAVLVAVLVDTGLTVDYLRRHLAGLGPVSLRIAALAQRGSRRIVPVDLAYLGMDAPPDDLAGYGLDHRGLLRNLAALWRVDPSAFDVGRLIG